MGFRMVSDSSG